MKNMMTPKEIVAELDRHIIGQHDAKRAVSIALRNRWRRQQVPSPMYEEITPKNILMIGPTGVGKTEIARRLARLTNAPFLKVEATKYTEVGYVGRDVESMIRDLVEIGIKIVREEHVAQLQSRAEETAEEKLLDILLPQPVPSSASMTPAENLPSHQGSREKMRQKLRNGDLDDRLIDVDVAQHSSASMQVMPMQQQDEMQQQLQDILGNMLSGQTKKKRMSVSQAKEVLKQQEAESLVDMDRIKEDAVKLTENEGIIFLDEIDKITHRASQSSDVSREGVQRDLLPIVEGTSVNTKYGQVQTDHILFIGSGAFHLAKPSDLIPELQGRFPIRVTLNALEENDFKRILVEPEAALTKQYVALLHTENVHLSYGEDGITELAKMAVSINEQQENIGARRLHTLLERVLEDMSFHASEDENSELHIDASYVQAQLGPLRADEDLSRYIL
ncbi:MAG: ATP-dependent protease ATPase subunit HslU [Mariprofundaceae bacterium]|nr:ATP-dependent protease ATPase subunit HslU [Mariprofundaceae bacterium]